MHDRKDRAGTDKGALRRSANIMVVLVNAVLLAGAFLLYALYTEAYEDRLRAENLGNIANLNQSAAMNVLSLFDNWNTKLNDIAQYAKTNDLDHAETLRIIDELNTRDDRFFQLIGDDYTGFLARKDMHGAYPPLNYANSSYASLQNVFDGAASGTVDAIGFAPEYTDGGDLATKFFAIYKYLTLPDAYGARKPYTLLLATRSKDVLAFLNRQENYAGQSTVLIDAHGNYIVGNADFKSANFFQYLYVYNDLSLDERNAIEQQMQARGSGELYYKNADIVVEDCVFRYERMGDNGWYCVTCVPLSSFHAPAFNVGYIIYAIALLLILFLVDIVWLQGMNRRLRASILREKEAGAAKGNFMSRMSHEIRTPLNAVIGYNTIARNELSGAQSLVSRKYAEMKVLDCLTKSDIASKHLLSIINDVLDMSAIESGKIQVTRDRFDFKGLITSLSTVFYSQARSKGVAFDVVFDTLTEEWFVGDQLRTNQILTNLLSNAVKFTPEGGSVTLKIQQPEAQTNAAHIHFVVSDTGIGMTKEYLSHIWTPFEQADSSISRRFGGTGLGLSITKSLVDLMGGTITVDSTPGVGTQFHVDLTFERTPQPQANATCDFSAVNALVVDDDASTCDYIRLLFNRFGARCATVTSGFDALGAFEHACKDHDPYTMCLVDWQMPDMDGIETIRRMRQITGGALPIVVLTAYDYSELADKAAAIAVTKFLSKPLFPSTLFDLLANTSEHTPQKPPEKDGAYDFGGARVLLAEDNAMNMEIAKTIMESANLIVDSAWNGREALEMFKQAPVGTYMAILMDVHMPTMNGHEATRAIRACAHPEATTIPIIAMTADAFAENVAEAFESGMNDHIAKPIDVKTLFRTLDKYRRPA